MPFVLEEITSLDRKKIVDDAKRDPAKARDLAYAASDVRSFFGKKWAVNRERNSYLLFAPILTRPETMGASLYFFFKGTLHEIRIETAFGSEVSIVDSPGQSLLNEFQEELAAAFAVFGRSGAGQKDSLGNPDSFVPEFRTI